MLRRLFLLLAASAALAFAADPAKAGLDPARTAAIHERMKSFVDKGYVSGVVTLIQRNGILAQFDATGWQDIEAKKPMAPDTIFQIMSMTKPITGVAIMTLVDEGRIRLGDPVEKHLPEFRGQMLVDSRAGETVTLRKPSRPVTIRDLMTHTSGLSGNLPPGLAELLGRMDRTLAESVAVYAQTALEFEPGSKWMYSNMGIATLGRIVEVVSGMPFEKYLAARIFEPLGMKDTHIFLPREKRSRVAPVYGEDKNGKLGKAGAEMLAGDPMRFREGAVYSGPEYAAYSTAPDLANFYQMMLNKGELNGHRILSPAAVATMTANHTGDIHAGWVTGSGFGLTWEVTRESLGTLTYITKGAYHHGGAFGTFGLVDPNRNLVAVFLIQGGINEKDVRDAFLEMTGAAIVP